MYYYLIKHKYEKYIQLPSFLCFVISWITIYKNTILSNPWGLKVKYIKILMCSEQSEEINKQYYLLKNRYCDITYIYYYLIIHNYMFNI